MFGLTWLSALLSRRRGRLVATAAGVAAAVALVASIGVFLSSSKATMTHRARARVPVDWQVEAQPGADPAAMLAAVRATKGAGVALPVGFATTSGFSATTGGSTQTTGPGVVLGLPDGYRSAFPGELRDLSGSPTGVLLAQQTAANLHAAPGDEVLVGRGGDLAPVPVRIDGIVDLLEANSLFQKAGAPAGAQPQSPPDNVLLLPEARYHELFGAFAVSGDTPAPPGSRPDLVRTQAHVKLTGRLPADPAAATTEVSGRARNLEVRLAGTGLVGDNLGATLGAARQDALYAQVLFLFLATPGVVVAGLLTASVAAAGADRRRREQALLRARGATTRRLVTLGLLEAGAVGLAGAAAGLGLAVVVGRLAFGRGGFGATPLAAAGWAGGAALAGLVIAAATVALPAWRDAKATVATGRRAMTRPTRPRWARAGLDLWLLAAGGLVFWLTSRGRYQLVLAPEGVPTISVSYWAFAGPALLWTGAGLLAWRVSDGILGRGRGVVTRGVRPLAGPLAPTVSASLSRQRRLLSRSLVLVTLTVSFAMSTAVFNATYRRQAEVDARLTNGADVTVTEFPGSGVGPATAAGFARLPGVRGVEPVQHRFAYVGADLQDLYGVRPSTIVEATKLQDAYFAGGRAPALIGELAARPDSVLVNLETVHDFQLHPGDALTLRLQDGRTQEFKDVSFHYAGVAKEFPTAPSDSFLVANADYVAAQTGSDAVGAFLLDTGGHGSAAVARQVRSMVGTSAQVTDIATSRRIIGSSLTAVDLGGLTRVELAFALVLAAAATGLVLALGLAERRRTFAIAAALGASGRQLGGFVWAEAGFVALGGLVAGALSGWLLSEMLVKVLTGVFDPPPAALVVPWPYLAGVTGAAWAATAAAATGALRLTRRPAVAVLRSL